MGRTRTVMIGTDDGSYTLDVNPSEVSVTQDSKDKTIDLLNVGEVNVRGNRGLVKTTLSTFLPASGSHFNRSGIAPETIIQSVRKAKNGKRPVRLIISGTDINLTFGVSSMEERYLEGQKDVYINWSFVEDRSENIGAVASQARRYTDTGLCERSGKQETSKTVTLKSGDNLWDIACREYGDGSRWRDIADANGIADDEVRRLQIGREVVIPA